MAAICALQSGLPRRAATVPEPYIPHIPDNWNGVLVLAEAQNHGKGSDGYLKRLKTLPVSGKIRRLYVARLSKGGIGIGPWDDGSLKLAVEAGLKVDFGRTAVSNGCLWTTPPEKDEKNRRPSGLIMRRSVTLWKEMLPLLASRLKLIVSAGSVARKIITKAGRLPDVHWRHPAYMRRVSKRSWRCSPEVLKLWQVGEKQGWVKKGYQENKLFFTCLAVKACRR